MGSRVTRQAVIRFLWTSMPAQWVEITSMAAIISPQDPALLSQEDLLTLVAELRRHIAELTSSNEALHAEIDQLKHGGKRQAAPISKGTRVAEPSPPGRKPGGG